MTTIYTTKPLPARRPDEHYPTEASLIDAAIDKYAPLLFSGIALDPGAGDGRWGQALKYTFHRAKVHGVELREVGQPHSFDLWWGGCDFLKFEPGYRYDLIIGNPPYGPKVPQARMNEKGQYITVSVPLAEHFIRIGFRLLSPGGRMIYLLPLQLQAGQDRYNNLWVTHPPTLVAVVSPRPSFGLNQHGRRGTNGTDYGLYCWDKTIGGVCAGTPRKWKTELFNYACASER
jgi:hypothetical protein